jgi:hypothetical protein
MRTFRETGRGPDVGRTQSYEKERLTRSGRYRPPAVTKNINRSWRVSSDHSTDSQFLVALVEYTESLGFG